MVLHVTDLPVGNYMTAYPISVLPDVSLGESIGFMARRGIGNLIVSEEDGTPLGILTERDILQQIVSTKTLPNVKIKEVSQQPFVKINPDTSILDAAKSMISKKARLLVFADSDKLVGIVTASDLVRAFRRTYVAPSLEEVVSKKIHRVSFNESILDAVQMMFEKGIGSVIVEGSQSDYGIFTERDLVFKVLNNHVQLDEKIELYSSFPLITAEDGILANEAASIMAANNIKRLALKDQDTITGIVTARDIVEAYQNESPHIKNY
jgi:CBS domain-containing protein